MNWFGSGFITQIIYANFNVPTPPSGNFIITETGNFVISETSNNLITE